MPSARCSLTLTQMLTLTAMLSHPSLYLFSGNAHICFDYKFHTPHSFHALHYFSEQLLCERVGWAFSSTIVSITDAGSTHLGWTRSESKSGGQLVSFSHGKLLNFCYISAYGTFESHTIEQNGGLSDSGTCKNNLAIQWFCSETSPRI